jgi:hypothetical protein
MYTNIDIETGLKGFEETFTPIQRIYSQHIPKRTILIQPRNNQEEQYLHIWKHPVPPTSWNSHRHPAALSYSIITFSYHEITFTKYIFLKISSIIKIL